MPVPFQVLSTGLVGNGSIDGSSVQELIGPGHASFVNDVTGTSRGGGEGNAEEDVVMSITYTSPRGLLSQLVVYSMYISLTIILHLYGCLHQLNTWSCTYT
jgi:hypothetical protein